MMKKGHPLPLPLCVPSGGRRAALGVELASRPPHAPRLPAAPPPPARPEHFVNVLDTETKHREL